jgi:CYTH domain-containing protein
MPLEIERKFLVTGNGWQNGTSGDEFCQGYIQSRGATVRVRRAGARAYVTIKGQADGIARPEFEYPIPVEDAEVMLRTLCRRPLIEKTRFTVRNGDHDWAVDVFAGANTGLVLAEIELTRADEEFARPDWVGREVTHDRRYKNSALLLGERGNAASRTQRKRKRMIPGLPRRLWPFGERNRAH